MRPTRPGIYTPKGADVYKGKSFLARFGEFLGGIFFLLMAMGSFNDPEMSGWVTFITGIIGLAAIGASFDSHEKV